MNNLSGKVSGRIGFYLSMLAQDMTAQATKDFVTFQNIRSRLSPYIGNLSDKVVLDIGCGRRYPFTLLFHNQGNAVTGIDTAYIGCGEPFLKRYWKELAQNGFESFGRALSLDLLRQRSTYYETLRKLCNFPLEHQGLLIKRMNAEAINFPDGTFDLVVSIACFEHIVHVQKAISEVFRVLKAGGVAYIAIHLFTSLSGGHHSGKQLERIPPWDHLRQNKYPVPVCLNRLRESEYIRLFSEKFEILEVIREVDEEGAKFLTPKFSVELSSYTKAELLTKMLILIAQRKNL